MGEFLISGVNKWYTQRYFPTFEMKKGKVNVGLPFIFVEDKKLLDTFLFMVSIFFLKITLVKTF